MKPNAAVAEILNPGGHLKLGEACVQQGIATSEEIRDCMSVRTKRIQAGQGVPLLSELLVELGYATPAQVSHVLSLTEKEFLTCLRCRLQFDVTTRRRSPAFLCPRCHHPLDGVVPPRELTPAVDERPIALPDDPVPPEVALASKDPSRRFGKYVLLKKLGAGGSGVIHLAWDTFFGQRVALKRLKVEDQNAPSKAAWEAQRILVEARSAVRLHHPAIVRIYDAGQIDQTHYISMEYVEGPSLAASIDAAVVGERLSPYHENPVESLTQLAAVARALAYAHSLPAPIFHCDLTPSNIVIDAEGRPRLLDFGLARGRVTRHGEDGVICGTPAYMSPEQAEGLTSAIDARTDVYGFGAMLYEMLTGRAPFRGRPENVLRAVVSEPPVPPSKVIADLRAANPKLRPLPIPAFVEDLCLRCLAKEKERRPATMLEVCELLERAARPVPNPAFAPTRVPGPVERSLARRKIVARRCRAWTSAAALLLGSMFLVPGSGATSAPAIDARDVELRLASFQPDRAMSLLQLLASGDAALQEESRRMRTLRDAMESRFPIGLASLRLKTATLQDVELDRGPDGLLRATGLEGRETILAWNDLEPTQIIDLAGATGVDEEPELRAALALYCRRVGRLLDAKALEEKGPGSSAAANPEQR